MKICLIWAAALLLPTTAAARSIVLTDTQANQAQGDWRIDSQALGIHEHNFSIEQSVLHGGRQEGSKIITIRSEDGLVIVLSPTRGMGLLHVTGKGIRLGWDSPVDEVVNPNSITLESRNGLGWLEGFNEMLVRCGYEWTGHPVTAQGMLYTLHGRAGNTPASKVIVDIDEHAPYAISVRGLLKEHSFKKSNLETWTELRYVPGSNAFTIHDVLSNAGDYAQDYQIIYHSNFGRPILEQGARLLAPAREVSPFNDYAKAGLGAWQRYQGPTRGFDEQVFNIAPYADSAGKTLAALVNRAGDKGVSIAFDTHQLPALTLWKNTDTEKQGYVTGIEPGTSYAYPVTIERAQGRVKQLQPGQHADFELTYTLLADRAQVRDAEQRVTAIQGGRATTLTPTPMAKE
ncbi:aldose 1-epimerase family protein [Xanthomonas translucens]|uniref:aldose 1-epimerase family protein n=1 Tax=Xanthomonas campestris pv. translucens TaxID=343 RepID=UPI0006423E78|nr:aldose 1-epimerase family protein [Xanthomonas translucens]AKK68180.1 hypothetical protein FD63_12190 [Xanthomonas translucens pv. undulosa]MCT8270108.1 aldose 1-epimerase family protein [Xanthomonas translucens pv. undulosa]WNJ31504.1 aldose 1-epimerase family protein [Xanthomonas translucens pv. undulosa]